MEQKSPSSVIFPVSKPTRAGWSEPNDIVGILDLVAKSGWKARLPSGQIVSPLTADFSRVESRCVEFNISDREVVLFSPENVRYELISDSFEYFWIDLLSLPITPNYREIYSWPVVERLTEVAPKVYIQPHFWTEGKLPNGDSLPGSSRFVLRCLDAGIILAAPGSPLLSMDNPMYHDGGEIFRERAERIESEARD